MGSFTTEPVPKSFKPGDWVKCIDEIGVSLKKGRIYYVTKHSDLNYTSIITSRNTRNGVEYLTHRFMLFNPPEKGEIFRLKDSLFVVDRTSEINGELVLIAEDPNLPYMKYEEVSKVETFKKGDQVLSKISGSTLTVETITVRNNKLVISFQGFIHSFHFIENYTLVKNCEENTVINNQSIKTQENGSSNTGSVIKVQPITPKISRGERAGGDSLQGRRREAYFGGRYQQNKARTLRG